MAAAYAALASLMHIIHKIQHHHAPPISLDKQQSQSLTENITFLQAFLESYNPPVPDDESPDPLEIRIADAAYAAEDVIESHIVDIISISSSASSSSSHLTRLFNCLQYPHKKIDDEQIKKIKSTTFNQNLQQAVQEMDLVRKNIATMSIDTEKPAVVVPTSAVAAPSSSGSTFSNNTATMVVGFDDASLEIMDKLTGDPPDLQVIPIAGMGGIGKTTLARNVFERKGVKDHFAEYTAWATISQQYNSREILCEVYAQVAKIDKKQLSGMSDGVLGSELHKCLFGRRFLIVMDDMWSIDAWNDIRHFFPENRNGSRILVTTRLYDLSFELKNEYALFMNFLDEANSWSLFSKTVFGEKKSCPRELEKIGKKIVESCRGLPLSILVVGGLLKTMDATERCWESIGRNLTSVVNLENEKHCLRLLRLSYNHLPLHVKPCFLYMGVFEEDAEIKASTVCKLWISEGFLKPMNGESLEASAAWCLKELVDRNLVRISRLGFIGNLKTCTIHDLLRDLCLKEGQKDEFYHVIGKSSLGGVNRQRRVVIPRNASKWKVRGELRSMPHARSVICENGKVPRCRNIGLLRTFHAYKFRTFEDKSYEHSLAFRYFNLRHLAVEGRNMSSFLSSLSLLWNLHTIIISCSHKSTTIPEIWKMPQLRHVEFVDNCLCLPDPPSVDTGDDDDFIIMENLHTLKGVRNFKCCEEVVKRIPNIKKLVIEFDGKMGANLDEYYGISNIELLCELESLSVSCSTHFRGSRYMHKLTFSHSLKKVCLNNMRGDFECENMLEKIGLLPLLEKLKLWGGCFRTGKWEIVEGQFPSLKYLGLFCCLGLESWITAEDSVNIFPCLQTIELWALKDLMNIPHEIGEIPTLDKMLLTGCSEAAVKSAKEMVDEQVEFQGDELPFHIVVELTAEDQGLQSLADKNFEVRCREEMRRVELVYAYTLFLNEKLKEDETK